MIEILDDSGVRLIAFARPETRNAFDLAMYRAARDALDAAGADDAVRAVVLTGRGGAFSSGQDLREMAAIAAGVAAPGAESGFPALLDTLTSFGKPLLAAVEGPAVGLGFTMLAHCDLVLVGESAKFRVPFAELGVPAEAASSYLFPLRMGWQQAARVLLTAEWVTAAEAVSFGMALRVCPDHRVLDETLELARRIAAFSPAAVQEIKRLMWAAHADAVARARDREDDGFRRLLSSLTAGSGPGGNTAAD